MSDKQNSEQPMSRRKFLKAGAIAGGAAVVGLSIGLPLLNQAKAETPSNTLSVNPLTDSGDSNSSGYNYDYYRPVTRKYFLYATDGIAKLPLDAFGSEHRFVYIYGFAKPLSDTRPWGSKETPTNPFADLNWIDSLTGLPAMRGKAQLTSPPIWGVEGDNIEITMFNLGFAYRNDIMDPHTVHLHGAHAPTHFDGIPELSFGVPMWTGTSITPEEVSKYSFTYKLFCERPGTYMYHCHVEASEHVQFGMYGPLWIYPSRYADEWRGGAAYNNSLTRFSQESIILLSEMDTRWHDSVLDLRGVTEEPIPPLVELRDPADLASFNPTEYRPDFWLVNGRAFPDTVLPGKYTVGYRRGSAPTTDTLTYYPQIVLTDGRKFFAPRQPVQTYVRTGVAEKVLVRMINMGFEAQPMHFHGTMPSVVGKDTFAWVPQPNSMFSTSTDERKRFFTLGIFSGETYDLILAYPDKSKISPIYANVLNNPQPNPFSPWETTWGNVIPAVAGNPPVPVAQVPSADDPNINVQGFKSGYPLFYLWHEHDDYKVTNNGVYPGGAVVLVRVDKDPPESTTSIPKHLIPS